MTLIEVYQIVAPWFYFAGALGLTSGVVALAGKRMRGNSTLYRAARILLFFTIFTVAITLWAMLGIWGFAPLEKELFGR